MNWIGCVKLFLLVARIFDRSLFSLLLLENLVILKIVKTLHKLTVDVAMMLLMLDHLPLDRNPDFHSAAGYEISLTISFFF